MLNDIKKESRTGNECCNMAEKAGRKVRELVDTTDKDINEVVAKTAAEIRRQPLQAGAIAVGIGFLLGTLFNRR